MTSLDYWRAREEAALSLYLRSDAEIEREIHRLYVYLYDELTKQINGFYQRYAKAEGITMAEAMERVSKMDVEAFQAKAKKYVKEKNFSKQANEELRLYNATMKINRLELLKAQMGLEMVDAFNDMETLLGEKLNDRAMDELRRQAGILGGSVTGNERWAREIVNASFHNATWSQRIWMYQTDLKNELSMLLTNGIIQGRNPRELAPHLSRLFGVSQSDALRLMRTEMARVQEDAQKRAYTEADIDQFIFIATEDAKTCEICGSMDGQVFEVKKMMPGENCAPMHPNCRCSTAAYVDRAALSAELGIDLPELEESAPEVMDAAKVKIREARMLDKTITTDLWNATKSLPGHFEGLEHRIKTEASLRRKIRDEAAKERVSVQDKAASVHDVLRYTFVSEPDNFVQNFEKMMYELQKAGYNITRVKNTFKDVDSSYRGVNMQLSAPNGYVFELQLHTPQSLEVKEINHKLYEEQRQAGVSKERFDELENMMRENARKIETPKGIDKIGAY